MCEGQIVQISAYLAGRVEALHFTILVVFSPFFGNSPCLPPIFAKNAPLFCTLFICHSPYQNVDNMVTPSPH